eukprot:940592-Prymnesium_polylepis.1
MSCSVHTTKGNLTARVEVPTSVRPHRPCHCARGGHQEHTLVCAVSWQKRNRAPLESPPAGRLRLLQRQ